MRAFFVRLWLATVCFFRILFDAPFAARVAAATGGPAPAAASSEPALQLLSLLQREGRLIDFCEEDLAGLDDARIGAAARIVHDGCRKALRGAFDILPIRIETEGADVTLPAGFDPRAVRLTGNVAGSPPFRGVLRHHGWRAGEQVLAPAEVELP